MPARKPRKPTLPYWLCYHLAAQVPSCPLLLYPALIRLRLCATVNAWAQS